MSAPAHQAAFHQVDGWYHAGNATLLGAVEIGAGSSIWYGAVLRGDDAPIRIGERVNIQDLCMVHPDPGIPLVMGDDITVGHRAILHCRSIGSRSLIGMGSILMEDVEIGEECLVAAGAVVPPGLKVPAGSLVRGLPGRVARPLTDAERSSILSAAVKYADAALATYRAHGG